MQIATMTLDEAKTFVAGLLDEAAGDADVVFRTLTSSERSARQWHGLHRDGRGQLRTVSARACRPDRQRVVPALTT